MRRRPAGGAWSTDRLLAAMPLAGLALGAVVFYGIQAWLVKTPWLFTDELEWTQLSRSIASDGEAARRGDPIFFKSLYAWLIAPAWWLPSTGAAYAAVKYVNTVVMLLAAVPTYLLARMLVTRRAALAVAGLTVAVPAMTYATSIVTEALAYTWFALSAWLAVRALTLRTPAAAAWAIAVAAIAPLVRQKFVAITIALLAAALFLLASDGGWRNVWRRWTRRELLAGLAVVAAAAFLVDWIVLERISSWDDLRAYLNHDTLTLGRVAGAAFVVGLGVLPAIGGLASLRVRDRLGDPAYRAFAAFLASAVATFGIYTATKAAYLSHIGFESLIEERNLFYLSPLFLLGTAIVLEARRIDRWLVGASAAFVLLLVWANGYVVGTPYFEAPGLGIVSVVNRGPRWDIGDIHWALTIAAAVALALIGARRVQWVPAAAALLVCAWMLTAQIASTAGAVKQANRFDETLPRPADWVDRATDGGRVTWLGQFVAEPNPLWLTEFWNRSVAHVAALDGSAPGPGPTIWPNVVDAQGTLSDFTGDPYVLAAGGVELQGELVAERGDEKLYRVDGRWRLREAVQEVYADGWASDHAAYTYFARSGAGVVEIDLSRTGYNGEAPPARVVVRLGSPRIDPNGQPSLRDVLAREVVVVANNRGTKVRLAVPSTPVHVDLQITATIPPSPGDPRQLGAQVAFRFVPG